MSESLAAASALPYPERADGRRSLADRLVGVIAFAARETGVRLAAGRHARSLAPALARIEPDDAGAGAAAGVAGAPAAAASAPAGATAPAGAASAPAVAALPVDEALLLRLRREGLDGGAAAGVLALVAAGCSAAIGIRPSRDEVAAARSLLLGRLVEAPAVDASLAVALAATVAALAGIRAHVLAVSPWCAARDHARFAPLHRTVGIESGLVRADATRDERRAAYAALVTYAWCRDVAFDYLRDRTVLGGRPTAALQVESLTGETRRLPQLLLRGLPLAFAADAEAIFIDDAGTPAAISGDAMRGGEHRVASQALDIAGPLTEGLHFRHDEHGYALTEAGRIHLGLVASRLGGVWHGAIRRERLVRHALVALTLRAGRDYEVRQGQIEADSERLDAAAHEAGAAAALKIMLEVRESCEPARRGEMLVRIGLQRLYRRYLQLGGVVADGRGIARELWSALGLARVRLGRRQDMPTPLAWHVFASAAARTAALLRQAEAALREGEALLIVMRDGDAAAPLRRAFAEARLEHRCWAGTQDRAEHEGFARLAGEAGVTIAVARAAAGTALRAVAGRRLRVIAVQPFESLRQERRFVARILREPGAEVDAACWVSGDDLHGDGGQAASPSASIEDGGRGVVVRRPPRAIRRAQHDAESRRARERRRLLVSETFFADLLSFSGPQV